MAYAPDGKSIAVGYRNGRQIEHYPLELDSAGTPSIHRRAITLINAHLGEVSSVRYVNAETLATCGTDEAIRLWRLSNEIGQTLDCIR